jgi:uncharacterized protein (DUF1800 family)
MEAKHLLARISFGLRPGEIEQVQKAGFESYVERQLHPETINDDATEARLVPLSSLRMSIPDLIEKHPLPRRILQELTAQKIVRAVHSQRQLQEVMTDFWFNHFNVFWGKGADRWLTTDFEMNAIRPNVLGRFKDLLVATARSPAMLFYLDNHLSWAPNPRAGRLVERLARRKPGINENYARELMELHTMGVEGGFTQRDVQEVARALTGWTINAPRRNGHFIFRPLMHDNGEKIVLGHKIKTGGIEDGETVLDLLSRHPSTARFIATKLVRKFVSDDPPRSLIDRVSAAYVDSNGEIRTLLRTIFFSPEFSRSEAVKAKTKSPLEFAASAIRILAGSCDGSPGIARMIARMGQPLYQCQPPTGFPDRGSHWMSNGSIIERINFAVAIAERRIPGTTADLSGTSESIALMLGSPDFQRR